MAEVALDLRRPTSLHLVGVGGTGMRAMAAVLVAMGHRVSGSDRADSPALTRLRSLGVAVQVGHAAANLGAAATVAVSSAVAPDNVEVVEARRRGLPVLGRGELLAALCATKRTVAVSGTHGKTTTTAMVATVLQTAGWRPSWIVGGDLVGMGSGAAWDPEGQWLVVEADESDGTFRLLPAEAALVTNVDVDHLDFFGDLSRLRGEFRSFLEEATSVRVACADDPGAAAAAAGLAGVVSYGLAPSATVRVSGIEHLAGGTAFLLEQAGHLPVALRLAVPGAHFALNAAGAFALAVSLGVEPGTVARGLAAYRGVGRRFEERGERAGVTFVDDYAHLPAEVAATLATARQGSWARLVAVFQPHRYSRTEALAEELGSALTGADVVVVTGVYPAGEEPRPGVSGRVVAEAAARRAPQLPVHYAERLDELPAVLAEVVRPGDLCLTMGAGDITGLAGEILGDPAWPAPTLRQGGPRG